MAWTEHEDNVLIENNGVRLKLLTSLIHKTPQQIASRRHKLGLCKEKRIPYDYKEIIRKCEKFSQKEFGFSCKKLAGIILRFNQFGEK